MPCSTAQPDHKEGSWARFAAETADSFFAGGYAEAVQARFVDEFEALLPDLPPWGQ